MPAFDATWLVGSTYFPSVQSVTINGTSYNFAAGTWYLRSATAAESLVDQLQTHMVTEGIAGAAVSVTRGRAVRIDSTDPVAIVWSSTELQYAFGFTGNLSFTGTETAPYPSPLLWSPGFVATRATADGQHGYPVEDERREISRDGTQMRSTQFYTHTYDELRWSDVVRSRVFYDPAASEETWGGTWMQFRRTVLVPNRRFKIHEQVTEEDGSTDAVTWDTALGNYRARKLPSGKNERNVAAANSHWGMSLEVIRG